MAWTPPRTWSADELIDETILNTHVRDNLAWLKTPPNGRATLSSQVTTTSTSFTDITGLSVTMTTSGGNVLCFFTGALANSGSYYSLVTLNVDGTVVGGTDGLVTVLAASSQNVSFAYVLTGLSAASHTIKMQWKTANAGGTVTLYANDSTSNLRLQPTLHCVEMG